MRREVQGFLRFFLVNARMRMIRSAIIVVLAVTGFAIVNVSAKSNYTDQFNAAYQTSGTSNGTTLGSCITCHNQADGSGGYNSYGTDWRNNGGDFAAVELLDSDGDGFDNIEEITAGTFPGDSGSIPATPPPPPPGTNSAPVADAGADQTVNEGAEVTLDGSASTDADGDILSYSWTQQSGPVVGLMNAFSATPTFVAPFADPAGGPVTLTFEITVSDGEAQSSTSCTVYVFPGNMSSVICATGQPIGLEPNGGEEILRLTAMDPPSAAPGTPVQLLYGLIDFEIAVNSPGGIATVVVHLPSPASPASQWFKYDPATGYFDFSSEAISSGTGEGAEFNADRTQVTIQIHDNGPYDADERNLIVRDPSGLGIALTDSSSTDVSTSAGGDFGSGGGGGGCFISSTLWDTGQ